MTTTGSGTATPAASAGAATLLALKGAFYRHLGNCRALVATGGSTSKFTMASLADLEAGFYLGWQLRVTSGASAGDLRVIGAGPNTAGDLEPKRIFSSTGPTTPDTAELWGNSIDGGGDLTALFNAVLLVARPFVPTKLTIVAAQRVYDITAYVEDPGDVRGVVVRSLDSAGVEPYRDREWTHFRALTLMNASTGAREVKVDLGFTLSAPATPPTQELYIHHYKTLAVFVSDTSTVEEKYADWLAWEAVLRHAVDMASDSKVDMAAWNRKALQAQRQVEALRTRYMAYVPNLIRPFEGSGGYYTMDNPPYKRS